MLREQTQRLGCIRQILLCISLCADVHLCTHVPSHRSTWYFLSKGAGRRGYTIFFSCKKMIREHFQIDFIWCRRGFAHFRIVCYNAEGSGKPSMIQTVWKYTKTFDLVLNGKNKFQYAYFVSASCLATTKEPKMQRRLGFCCCLA